MKKVCLLMAAALLVSVSCNKKGNAQMEPGADPEARVPVSFSSNLKGVQLTKGAGALDAWTENEDLHIIGLTNAAGVLDYDNPFIADVTAKAKISGAINLINPAVVDPSNPSYMEPFYYGVNDCYDFFGYYADDAVAAAAATLGENGYYVHAVIDGTQDLMVACAAKENDKNVPVDRVFSAYSARRDVHPNLLFKHKLARFNFFLRSGSALAHEKVTIKSIAVQSNTEADMIVAAPGADVEPLFNLANPAYLTMDFTASPLTLPEVALSTEDPNNQAVPGSLMVIPGAQVYPLRLQLIQTGATTQEGNVRDMEIDFNKIIGGTGNKFAEPGYQYNVTIVVYGLEDVKITVSLDEWHNGGSTVIDSDAE